MFSSKPSFTPVQKTSFFTPRLISNTLNFSSFILTGNRILNKICSNINDGLPAYRSEDELANKQAVAYYRVSTQRQGRSGLGLDAQQTAIINYCKLNDYDLVHEEVEVKSTRKHRVGLFQALDLCKKIKATLIVARLDRLGRDVEEIAGIVKSNVEIIVSDNPKANRLTIHILAAVAEDTRQKISETTKEALGAAKRRGVILGKNGKILSVVNKKAAEDFAHKLSPLITKLKNRGITTVRAVSRELNKRRIPTFRGDSQWHPSTVFALMNRLNK